LGQAIVVIFDMFGLFKKTRRARLRERAFPQPWRDILTRNVPYVAALGETDLVELLGHVQVFLAEKHFEGCGGLALTDEIRVTVAAQACVLLLHRETDYYPLLDSILIYPSTYVVSGGQRTPDGLVVEGPQPRLGESSSRGVVVLAWDNVLSGAADVHDGHNVVLHEFAHQLDQESGGGDGAPALPRRSAYVAWARVLGHEYDALVREVGPHPHRPIRDDESGGVLRRRHGDLLREAPGAARAPPGAVSPAAGLLSPGPRLPIRQCSL
jgi:MtfA peptidase